MPLQARRQSGVDGSSALGCRSNLSYGPTRCGITGVVGSLRTEGAVLARMNAAIVHRGPDGEGTFWSDQVGLAMRRLAIIDLVTGDQPIFNEDVSVCVVYNGEIYNFRELRLALEQRGHH